LLFTVYNWSAISSGLSSQTKPYRCFSNNCILSISCSLVKLSYLLLAIYNFLFKIHIKIQKYIFRVVMLSLFCNSCQRVIKGGALARKQLFCKLKHRLVCWGLQMCCFVRWHFSFFYSVFK